MCRLNRNGNSAKDRNILLQVKTKKGNQIDPDLHFIEKFIPLQTKMGKMTIESKWSI